MGLKRLIVWLSLLSAFSRGSLACTEDNLLRALENAGSPANTFCMQYTQTASVPLPAYLAATYPATRVSSACTCLNAGITSTTPTTKVTQPCAPQTITLSVVTLPAVTVTVTQLQTVTATSVSTKDTGSTATAIKTSTKTPAAVTVTLSTVSILTVTATNTITTGVTSTVSRTETPLCAVTGAFRDPALADYQFFSAGDAAILQCESNCISTSGCLSYALQIFSGSQVCYLYSEPVAQERDTTTTDVALYFYDLGCVIFPVTSLAAATATTTYTTIVSTTATATYTTTSYPSRPLLEGKNYVLNPGFEQGESSWSVIFPNNAFNTPTGYFITSNPADVYTGTNAFVVPGNPSGFVTLLEQQVDTTANNPYFLSVFAKLTANSSAPTSTCYVSLVVAGKAYSTGNTLTTDWQNYDVVWPGSSISSINVGVEVSGCTDECVFDDFFFTI